MKKWNILGQLEADLASSLSKVRGLDQDFFSEQDLESNLKALLPNLEDFQKLVKNRIKAGDEIYIHGDYDVDGICATAILHKTIKEDLNYDKCFYFIPDRLEDGYGLSRDSIDKINSLSNAKAKTLITVDCGVTASDSVEYAKSLGFKVVVTDHHQLPERLPNSDLLVWSDKVCGSAVALGLSYSLLGVIKDPYLGLTALATVADLLQLRGFNRTLVKKGLRILQEDPPLGIKKILEVAQFKFDKNLGTYELGWLISPRLNASGRLESALDSLKLVLSSDDEEALALALRLNSVNADRQNKTLTSFEHAKAQIDPQRKIILVSGEGYHEGIVGLVAGRLLQEFSRPSIAVSMGKEFSKGSGRSLEGIDLTKLLRRAPDLFENLGGHPLACGFTIRTEKLPSLSKFLLEEEETIDEGLLLPKLTVDLETPLDAVTSSWLTELKRFEPYGFGNSEPIFVARRLKVMDVRTMGASGAHLRVKLLTPEKRKIYNGVYFGGGKYAEELADSLIDVAFSIKENLYNGNVYLDLHIKDFAKSSSS